MPLPCRPALSAALAASALALAGCTTVFNPAHNRAEVGVLSEETLRRNAAEAREALVDEHGLYVHPPLQAYVTEIGLKMARVSQQPDLPWTFTVLDTEVANAFALPGGQVFITRGLIALLQNEAELAAALGHEVGHVAARHGAARANDAALASVSVSAAIGVGQFLERTGFRGAAQRMKKLGLSLAAGMIASYNREQELEADRLGADYVARAGYDARQMVGVLQMLQMVERFNADRAREAKREAPGSDWLSDHPATDQRLRQAQSITALARRVDNEGRQRFLERTDGLVWGDSPDKGLARDGVFIHPRIGYAITAPKGWDIDVDGSAAALHSETGDATLTVRLVPRIAGSTREQVVENLLAPTSGNSQTYRIGNYSALHFVGRRTRGDVSLPLRATVVSGPGGRLYLLDYTARDEAALARALPAMLAAEKTFRALTGSDRKAAQTWRVRRTTVPAGGYTELAKSTPLGDAGEATLRLLNGVYGLSLAEAPEPAIGSTVKTVRSER